MNNDCNHNKCQCGSCKCGISLKSIPAVLGDDTGEFKPENGAYFNTFVKYEANGAQYFYSKDGVFSKVAEVPECIQEQSDWDETDESSPAFIKNKPEIGDVTHLMEMIEAETNARTQQDESLHDEIVTLGNELNTEATTRAEQDEFLHNENIALGNELNAETNARTQKDTQLENAINSKADQYALDVEIANRTSEDATLSARIDALSGLEYEVVQQLPATGRKSVIYLVPQDRQAPDVYDEYLWVNTAFERIGSTAVDLTGYVKNTDYATDSKAGVIIANGAYGFGMNASNHRLTGTVSTYETYQNRLNEHVISKGTLENVIAGKGLLDSSALTDYVKNTDYAGTSTGGVVKTGAAYGTQMASSGVLTSVTRTYDQYTSGNNAMFIGKATLENVITGKGLVASEEAQKLKVLSQEEYDALTPASDTIYFIKEA